MSLTTRIGLLAGASALMLTAAGNADTTLSEQDRIAELEAKVAQLEAGDNWLTEKRADEVRSLVHEVLADADTRASLLQSGMNAGYDGGFYIGSSDGNFLLKINGQIQVRWLFNQSDGGVSSLDQEDADDLFDDAVGSDLFQDAVVAEMSSSQLETLSDLEDALDEAEFDGPLSSVLAAEQALDAFIFSAFQGYPASTKDDVIAGLGLETPSGDPIETVAAFNAEVDRFVAEYFRASIAGAQSNDGTRYGFENTRTKLTFSGHVVNPQWKYKIQGNFGRKGDNDGQFTLEDAYITYDYGNGWSASWGQAKAPFLREELVSSTSQLAVERSLVNTSYTASRVQGIWGDYRNDSIHFVAAYHNGAAMRNSAWSMYDTEWAFTGRLEWLAQGNWGQFSDFTSPQGSETGILLGAALLYQQAEFGTGVQPNLVDTSGTPNNDELEIFSFTLDASIELDGANLFGAFIYRTIDTDAIDAGDNDQIAFVAQGGFYFTENLEGFLRYEWSDYDIPDLVFPGGQTFYSFDDLSIATAGVNVYFNSNVKWTTDLGYAFDRVEFFAASDRAGYRSDTGGDDGQFVFRTQLQLLF